GENVVGTSRGGVEERPFRGNAGRDAPVVHRGGRDAVPIGAELLTLGAAGAQSVHGPGLPQCSAPPARATSCSVRSATSTIRARARAPVVTSTTPADGTWTKPPRIPASTASVASRCCSV